LLRIQRLDRASKIWEEIRMVHEGKSDLVQIDLHRRLHETRCEEGGDIKAHLGELLRLRESLASMGASLDDRDFAAIIMGSLPESYRPILSSMNAAARVSKKTLSPEEIMGDVSEEYEHRVIVNPTTSKKGGNSALTVGVKPDRSKGRNSGGNSNITCYNCNNVGHVKANCWSKGGGKEGQRPQRWGQRNGNSQHPAAANTATQSTSTMTPVVNYAFATSDLANVAKQLNIPVERHGAIVDSGATSHFCPNRSKFTSFIQIEPQSVHTANGSSISATGRGDVQIDLPLGSTSTQVTLKDTLYTPKMAFTLISTNHIAAAGLAVHFEDKMCKILSPAPTRQVIAEIPQINGLYSIAASASSQRANVAKLKLTISKLHRILGHVSHPALHDAVTKGLVEGVELDSTSKAEFCEACMQAKATHQSFPKETLHRAKKYGELIHTDLWGPAQTATISRCLYYISFTNNFSRETQVAFLKHKSEVLVAFKTYETMLTTQHDSVRIKVLRSD
jgi:hypothetical protein